MKVEYLQVRGQRLRYRRRIPEAIQPFFGGRAQVVQALGLRVGQEARAIELIRRIDRDVSKQLLRAQKALRRKEDPTVLAELAEEWALQNKYLGPDQSGLQPIDEANDASHYDIWVDRIVSKAQRAVGVSREAQLEDLSLEDQYRVRTVKKGKRLRVPLSVDQAIETYTELRHDGDLPKAEAAAFKQLRDRLEATSSRLVGDVNRATARDFLSHLANARGQSAATIRRRLNSLRALWSFALDHFEINAANPWARLEVPKAATGKSSQQRLPFNEERWEKIDAFLSGSRGDVSEILSLLKATGCRPLEISGFAAEDIINVAGFTSIHVRPNAFRRLRNAESERVIPITDPEALDVIASRSSLSGSLFPPSLHGTSNLSQRLNGAIRRAGVPKSSRLTAYSIRHSIAEALRVAGVPDHHLKAVLGHADPTTTGRYGAGGVDMKALARGLDLAKEKLGEFRCISTEQKSS